MRRRTILIKAPFDLVGTLAPVARGRDDPTTTIDGDGFWRAMRTPDGPATTLFERRSRSVAVTAWGPGAEWALEHAPVVLGIDDDPSSFEPRHDVIRALHRRHSGIRLGATHAVVEALVPSILEQKVTGVEARRSFARLVRRYGDRAPGPKKLFVPPQPGVLAALPYYAFHPLGVERRRADVIRRVCARAGRLEECSAMALREAYERLRSIDGIGAWTAAEVGRIALGDRDAVSVGDFHLPRMVAYVLAGEDRADDARMLELLEPYAGSRARAVRYIEQSGMGPPRRAPRRELRRIEAY